MIFTSEIFAFNLDRKKNLVAGTTLEMTETLQIADNNLYADVFVLHRIAKQKGSWFSM